MADREGPIHKGVFNLAGLMFPGALVHHSPNERKNPVEQRKAAQLGTVKGFPDIMILWRSQFMAVEVKASSGLLALSQIECGRRIADNGGRWDVVRSVDEAARIFADWKSQVEAAEPVETVPLVGEIS